MDIKLENGVWSLNESERLGPPGGFGEVFKGTGPDGAVAIKRLKITANAAAHREMNIGRVLASRSLQHVVPVLDSGQDAETDRYYLVMPVCDYSLQDHLNRVGQLDWATAKPIILDIIHGLLEVGDIVHRDLKPGNVLWHEGRWKIADFGIAKFVEDSTSLQTLRDALTPAFGAPEQWLGESPTRATDVYALACMMHVMINGRPPFVGEMETVRQGHLQAPPPSLTGVPPSLSSLVLHMLRKPPPLRPSLERCEAVMQAVDQPARPASNALAAAAHKITEQETAAEAERRAAEALAKQRALMSKAAQDELRSIRSRLYDEICRVSDTVRLVKNEVLLGPARLLIADPDSGLRRPLEVAPQRGSFWDILTSSRISLQTIPDSHQFQHNTYTVSATLVFAKTADSDYRWRELSFWSMLSHSQNTPFSVDPSDTNFQVALSNVLGGCNLAHGPLTIDAEDETDFQDRWIGLFTRAVNGQLSRPNQMPPPPSFFRGDT